MTTLEVSKLTGASIRQLQWWDERNVVVPDFDDLGNRQYGPRAVRDAQIAADLRRKGITRLDRVGVIIKAIGKRHGIAVVMSNSATFTMTTDHRSAAVAAEKVRGAVIIINVQPLEE